MVSLENLWFIFQVLLGFGLLIFVHELGHFLVAKWVGVRVERFSLGFGPKLFGFTRGDTEYLLSVIPLGGYVKMAGENVFEDTELKEDEFHAKKPWERSLIIIAGPVMNLIFAIPAATLMFLLGYNQPSTLCGIINQSPAAKAGLEDGDRILSVNGEPVFSFPELKTRIYLAPPNETLKIRYRRDGNDENCIVSPVEGVKEIGLMPFSGTNIYDAEPDSPAARAGISRGDRIVSIAGTPVQKWDELARLERENPGKIVAVTLERPVPIRDGYREYKELETEIKLETLNVYDLGTDVENVTLPMVGEVNSRTPAAKAGMQRGDAILEIDGKPIGHWKDLVELVSPSAGIKLHLKILREGKTFEIDLVPKQQGYRGIMGITPLHGGVMVKGFLRENTPAEAAGVQAGDIIYGIGEDAVWGGPPYRKLLKESKGKEVQLKIFRRGEQDFWTKVEVAATPEPARFGYLGLIQGTETSLRKYGLAESVAVSFPETWKVIRDTLRSIHRLVTGSLPFNLIGGPVGISTALFYKAREGFAAFVHLLFIISVNLALINLFPIPILDGGHLVLLAVEKLKGQPVKEKTMIGLQYVGLALLLALVIFATKNDFVNFGLVRKILSLFG